MTDEDEFTIDPAELDRVITELRTSRRTLGRLLGDLRQQMRTLQSTWEGLSADAQAVAQEEWEQGMREMNDALDELIVANRIAHGNYTGAVDANVSMWRELL
jgi:WXG100 family type VII secretion target